MWTARTRSLGKVFSQMGHATLVVAPGAELRDAAGFARATSATRFASGFISGICCA
jgi:hypothetical protein